MSHSPPTAVRVWTFLIDTIGSAVVETGRGVWRYGKRMLPMEKRSLMIQFILLEPATKPGFQRELNLCAPSEAVAIKLGFFIISPVLNTRMMWE